VDFPAISGRQLEIYRQPQELISDDRMTHIEDLQLYGKHVRTLGRLPFAELGLRWLTFTSDLVPGFGRCKASDRPR
jgi:hypothetical protein